MAKLTDYLDRSTLKDVQNAFSAVADRPIQICTPGGQTLLEASSSSTSSTSGRAVRKSQRGGDTFLGDLRRTTESLLGTSAAPPIGPLEVPVELDGEVIGRLRMQRKTAEGESRSAAATLDPFQRNLLRLMGNVLTRMCRESIDLHSRVEQLLAMHRVTAAITEEHDLKKVLDTVARTVVEAMGARASTIRLISANRKQLLIKSGYNISAEYLDKGPILLEKSPIDKEVIRGSQCVYIADMSSDPRVLYPSEAKREGLISCLCASMIYKNRSLGVLRVYMGEWHEFDWFQRQLLQTLANWAAAAIANARLYDEAIRSTELKRQLQMAGEVQRRMIPHHPPNFEGFDIAGKYVPSAELAGDFYDYIDLPPDNLGIAIGDVVGKGVRASLLMASIRASLRAHAINVYDMSDVLGLVNRDLCRDSLTSDFATMFYGVLNRSTRDLTYACAGHMPPILVRDGQTCHLETRGGILGLREDMDFPVQWFTLRPGDVVLAYTDGLSEAVDFAHKQYGRQRIEKAIQAAVSCGYDAAGIIRHILWDLRHYTGLHRLFDDLTLVVIRAT